VRNGDRERSSSSERGTRGGETEGIREQERGRRNRGRIREEAGGRNKRRDQVRTTVKCTSEGIVEVGGYNRCSRVELEVGEKERRGRV